jgi:hypothetical protein
MSGLPLACLAGVAALWAAPLAAFEPAPATAWIAPPPAVAPLRAAPGLRYQPEDFDRLSATGNSQAPRPPVLLDAQLVEAARQEDLAALTRLLEAGASPDARDGLRVTPVQAAARSGRPEHVRVLLRAGANPDGRAPDGFSGRCCIGPFTGGIARSSMSCSRGARSRARCRWISSEARP